MPNHNQNDKCKVGASMSSEMTEAEYLDSQHDGLTDDDNDSSEFSRFLYYHEIDAQDYACLSGNEKRNMWWNFRKFGKKKG